MRSACLREARIVRDHADRRARAVEILEQVHHGLAVDRVEVSGRLVGEQDERRAGDRARDGDALLLAARELRREVLHAVRHADLLERLLDALLALVRGHAAVGQRQLDVLVDREVADQVEALEDEADLAVADARALGERQRLGRLAVQGSTCRAVGESSRPRSDSSVDLPQPDGPAIDTYSPCAISRWMPESACVSTSSVKKTLVTPSSLMTGWPFP